MQDLSARKASAANADEALRKLDAAGMSKARGAAQAALDALMLTDAPLLYSPSLVALAALRAGFRKVHLLFAPWPTDNTQPSSSCFYCSSIRSTLAYTQVAHQRTLLAYVAPSQVTTAAVRSPLAS